MKTVDIFKEMPLPDINSFDMKEAEKENKNDGQ